MILTKSTVVYRAQTVKPNSKKTEKLSACEKPVSHLLKSWRQKEVNNITYLNW